MRRQVFYAFGIAALVGGALGAACDYPQPALECNFQASYWVQYTLVSDPDAGACAKYEGDRVEFARYRAPDEAKATFALNTRRMGLVTRALNDNDEYFRFDPSEPAGSPYQHESALATFQDVYPDSNGFCSNAGAIRAADQNLPAADAGSTVLPATHIKYDWSNFRMLNTARFVSNVFEADLTVTVDSCTATYKAKGIFPARACNNDARCDPLPDVAAGRVTGSGMSVDYAPKCHMLSNPDPLSYEKQYFGVAQAAWKPNTDYSEGDVVYSGDPAGLYTCVTEGKSAAADAGVGPSGTGDAITDGTVVWKYKYAGKKSVYSGVCLPTVGIDDLAKLK